MATLNLLRTGDTDHGSPLANLLVYVDGREAGSIGFDEVLVLDLPQGLRTVEVAWEKWSLDRRMVSGNPTPEALRSPPLEVRLLPGETVYLACGVRQVREQDLTPLWLLRQLLFRSSAKTLGLLEVWPRTPPGESPMERFLSKRPAAETDTGE